MMKDLTIWKAKLFHLSNAFVVGTSLFTKNCSDAKNDDAVMQIQKKEKIGTKYLNLTHSFPMYHFFIA